MVIGCGPSCYHFCVTPFGDECEELVLRLTQAVPLKGDKNSKVASLDSSQRHAVTKDLEIKCIASYE